MTDDEVFHAMSMVFPDVRLKSYVEIRPADSMPIPMCWRMRRISGPVLWQKLA